MMEAWRWQAMELGLLHPLQRCLLESAKDVSWQRQPTSHPGLRCCSCCMALVQGLKV